MFGKRILPLLFALSLLVVGLFALLHSKPCRKVDVPAGLSDDSVYLICRMGDGFFSDYFKKYASRDKEFSHIGILARKNSEWVVYHSEASELTGAGEVRRESLYDFLKGLSDYAFYHLELDGKVKHRILKQAEKLYRAHIPFDLQFDYSDNSKLYCTEFVAKTINCALGKDVVHPTFILKDKVIVSIDDIIDCHFVKLFQKFTAGQQ